MLTLRRHVRGWLFWLALLLPIAQAMAATHVLSHVSGDKRDEGVAHLVHCDLCLTAAHLAGSAPTAAPAALPAPPAVHVLAPHLPGRAAPRRPCGLALARAPPTSA